jgi:hypothetical protein
LNFGQLIDREADVLRKLHDDLHYHFDRKARGSRHARLWREACARFHAHVSPLDDWAKIALSGDLAHSTETQDFVLTFLERDPMYFRSGYLKEALLRHLKRADLAKAGRERVGNILLDAVRCRGQREFRRYCHLAANLGTAGLRAEIDALTSANDNAVASRARMMLRYLREPKDHQT